ncbi:MAG: calcium/sodium antiporter [Prevotella sp.]|nr:calcium/sodium antiporter [Prevotella sp.]MBR3088364.1 calcium/sodium antiporter [Prevotella sp.]MBR7030991.1 calcium/sodium antiporter [Prevotella sp.]
MILNILFIIAGVFLVLWGADRMTDGAVSIAQRLNIPQIVIGLTIVAMGTSMPEFCVSLVSALKGTPDLAVGNVVGSNIFNVLLIVGVAALVAPMIISRSTVKKDIPWAVFSAIILSAMCLDHDISRIDALILTIGIIAFMIYTLRAAKKGEVEQEEGEKKDYKPIVAVGLVLLGMACLIFGSNLFVDAATKVAQELHVSEGVIGLTIVAGGTSLPELATSVVAARKGQSAIAIGNVIGSNVFNTLMIVGVTGLICPMQIEGITPIDLAVMTISIALLWFFSYTKFTVERWEGALLTLIFTGYMAWLISNVI